MKKLFFALLLVLAMVGLASAQTWTTANSIKIDWNPVTVSSGTVSYKLYSKLASGGPETFIRSVTTLSATVTFTVEGRYFLGVRTVRTVDGVELEAASISWSNDPVVCQGGATFGIQYYSLPANTGGIRIGGQ